MKTVMASMVCVLLLSLPAAAQDASGIWDATFNTAQGARHGRITLKKDGETLTGAMVSDRGEVSVQGTQKGTAVTIAFTVATSDGPRPITLTGTQNGESMAGAFEYGDWSAKRSGGAQASGSQEKSEAPDVSGPWALQVEIAGNSGSPNVTFKQEGEKLTGRYVGQFGEADVTGSLKGREITWTVDLKIEGNAVRVVYRGTVEKDTMKGTVTFGELGEGTFTGQRK